jgi:hypothetical protein
MIQEFTHGVRMAKPGVCCTLAKRGLPCPAGLVDCLRTDEEGILSADCVRCGCEIPPFIDTSAWIKGFEACA